LVDITNSYFNTRATITVTERAELSLRVLNAQISGLTGAISAVGEAKMREETAEMAWQRARKEKAAPRVLSPEEQERQKEILAKMQAEREQMEKEGRERFSVQGGIIETEMPERPLIIEALKMVQKGEEGYEYVILELTGSFLRTINLQAQGVGFIARMVR
jgi:hypothetical protein